jgi:uncharacterized membrane protein SpoIIM required for sporulation
MLLFLRTAILVFVLTLVAYQLSPQYTSVALRRIMSFYQHHFDFLGKVLSDLALIFLNNFLAALMAMGLGSVAVWWVLRSAESSSPDSSPSSWIGRWIHRFSEALVDSVHRLAIRVHPHLQEVPNPYMQQTVALAVLPPVLSMTVNGAIMGLWSAMHFTHTYWEGLSRALLGILPHGVIELPTMWLAAASGLHIAGLLIYASRHGPQGVRAGLRSLVRSPALQRTVVVVLLLIATAATLETRISWELQETLLAQVGGSPPSL